MIRTLSIDIETYSEIDLQAAGAYRYTEDPSFEILLFGYSINYGEPRVVDLANGEEIPAQVLSAITDPAIRKTAYNAPFERCGIAGGLGLPCPPAQWECSMVLAAQVGLPFGLEILSTVMGLPEDKIKMREGKALIRYFCSPCKPTKVNGGRTRNLPEHDPDKWELFKEYCKRDVEAENYIRQQLSTYAPNSDEQRFWNLDQRINDRGVRVDMQLVTNAMAYDEQNRQAVTHHIRELTGIENPNSDAQIKDWLVGEEGILFPSLDKRSLATVYEQLTSARSVDLLDLRTELSKSSIAKYDAIARSVNADGRVRGLLQFYGANRTGRFSGRLVQVQNLPRNKSNIEELTDDRERIKAGQYENNGALADVLSNLIRTAFIPDPGHRFLVADFSAIEARVIAWFAKEEWVLDEFMGPGKIYEATAAQMFGVAKEKIARGNPEYELRQKGKIATLACGYGGGVAALKAMGALESGLAEEELPDIINKWRSANPRIVAWWYSLDTAAKRALQEAVAVDNIGGITFRVVDGHLFVDLPSGRSLIYYQVGLGVNRFGGSSVVYQGMNQVTRKWETLETYGGKLAENIVQATARDCLRDSMFALDQEGYDIVMHIHDEVVLEEPIGWRTVEDACEVMSRPLVWAPGLPLAADGFETYFYRKD